MESLMAVCFKDLPEDQVGPKGDELLIADDHGLQDIDRHLPKALRSDVKACAQCGVTKTPQWREGPHGPKTLCNACGVKRVRQMKSLSDSSKRRASRGQPPSFREDSNEAVQQSELRNEPQLRYNHRPSRQGAARPGLLVDLQQDGNDAAEPDHFAVRRSLSSNSDASYHQCDNVEEETCGTGRPEHVPLKSPMSAMVGSECAAAVNLLSMTVREGALPLNTLDEHIAKQGSNTSFAQTASTSLKQTISSFSDFGQTHDFIMQNVHFLPLEKQREWNTVKGQMDTILQQSAAANAAVAAVAKVLAMKQAEAMEARQQANARAQYLRPIMQQIKEECMSSHNKRRRT